LKTADLKPAKGVEKKKEKKKRKRKKKVLLEYRVP
jgi:hypothetical protein